MLHSATISFTIMFANINFCACRDFDTNEAIRHSSLHDVQHQCLDHCARVLTEEENTQGAKFCSCKLLRGFTQ